MHRGIVFGACDWCVWPNEPEALCSLLAQEGIGALQVLLTKSMLDAREGIADPARQARLRTCARDSGILIAAVMGSVLDEVSVSAQFEQRDELMDYLQRTVDIAVELGAEMIVAPLFGVSNPSGTDELARAAGNLAQICDYAAERGIVVGVEDILSADELEVLLHLVNRPNLKLFFDSQNYPVFRGGENAAGRFRRFAGEVCGVHFKDCNSSGHVVRLGEGITHYLETAEAVANSDYKGCVILENDYLTLAREAGEAAALEALHTDLLILKSNF